MNNFKDNKIKKLENKKEKLKNENDFFKIGSIKVILVNIL